MSENEELNIGKKLHDKRVEMGLTLDDLQQSTKIQKRYLIAIEDEKFDELPGDFYVRAFVKQYAESVGMDGNELLVEYNEQLPETKTTEYSDHITKAVETRTGKAKAVDQVDKFRQYLPTALVVVVIVVILGAIWLTAIHSSRQSASNKIDSSSVSVSGESSKKKAKKASSSTKKTSKATNLKWTKESQTSSAATFKLSKQAKYKLTITPKNSMWVTVTGDGSSLFAKTLTGKKTITIDKNVSRVVVSLGNTTGATIKINGKKVNFTASGNYPSVRTITFTSGSTTTSSAASSSAYSSSTYSRSTNNTTSTYSSSATTNSANSASSSSTATTGAANQTN